MVSFSCEHCADVLTKKKLDPHRSHCRGAVFTCLDCQTTFAGTSYRAHTSCMTEDQKYQGALYRSKASKAANRKSVSILEPTDQNALVPHQAYVEDVAEQQEVPPPAPTPPSGDRSRRTDSVFDYMVEGGREEDESGTPQIAFSHKAREEAREEMSMKSNAPAVFSDSRASSRNGYRSTDERQHSQQYDEVGFSYGTGPVNQRPYSQGAEVNPSLASLDFMTPSARATRLKLEQGKLTPGHARTNSGSEKKRKRDYSAAAVERDTPMTDAPHAEPGTDPRSELVPAIIHSGLTGGLNKMMTHDSEAFPYPQPVGPDDDKGRLERRRSERRHEKREDPTSPLKRTRHSRDDNGLGITIKGRAVKALSVVGGAFVAGQRGELTKTRRRTSSSDHTQAASREPEGERRERKKHKVHRHNGTASANVRHEPRTRRRSSDGSAEASRSKVKAIEYRKPDEDSEYNTGNGAGQMVVFGAEASLHTRCQAFLSSIPGREVENGYSVHKALKRWHKQCDNSRSSKQEDEQELWSFNDVFFDGFDDGFFGGIDDGFFDGFDDGFFGGIDDVFFDGFDDGFFGGIDDGFFDGFDDGFFGGFDDNLDDDFDDNLDDDFDDNLDDDFDDNLDDDFDDNLDDDFDDNLDDDFDDNLDDDFGN
ncbi:hypothetical protein DV737_g2258, partial [Chaetothyriales sp. CBS 132003]